MDGHNPYQTKAPPPESGAGPDRNVWRGAAAYLFAVVLLPLLGLVLALMVPGAMEDIEAGQEPWVLLALRPPKLIALLYFFRSVGKDFGRKAAQAGTALGVLLIAIAALNLVQDPPEWSSTLGFLVEQAVPLLGAALALLLAHRYLGWGWKTAALFGLLLQLTVSLSWVSAAYPGLEGVPVVSSLGQHTGLRVVATGLGMCMYIPTWLRISLLGRWPLRE